MILSVEKKNEFNKIALSLLDKDINIGQQFQVTRAYRQFLLECSSLDLDDLEMADNINLDKGMALGTAMAARCLDDVARTYAFVNGLDAAIQSAKNTFNDECIRIIYAGTGPFATLALPIMAKYSPEEVQFDLIEINPKTLNFLNKIINALSLHDYIEEVKEEDATKAHFTKKYHIVLSETLQHALVKEPQVSMMLHLSQYLHPNGLMVPESIHVEAYLLNVSKYTKQMLHSEAGIKDSEIKEKLCTVLNLNEEFIEAHTQNPVFPIIEIPLPNDADKRFDKLALMTTLTVYGNFVINHWDSGLTIPYMLLDKKDFKPDIKIQYEISDHPHYILK